MHSDVQPSHHHFRDDSVLRPESAQVGHGDLLVRGPTRTPIREHLAERDGSGADAAVGVL
jgi:hypothetical protein